MSFPISVVTYGTLAFCPKLRDDICDVICNHNGQRHRRLRKIEAYNYQEKERPQKIILKSQQRHHFQRRLSSML